MTVGGDASNRNFATMRATAIGCVALALWSALALLTTAAGAVPPFQLTAMTFVLAALLAVGKWLLRGEDPRAHLRIPVAAWALGVGGLFGYHALYFAAFARAPAVDVNLITYLWPLLIVLFAGLLPGERIATRHVIGACLGLAGVAVLTGAGARFDPRFAEGYALALACAVVWAGYSTLSRRFGDVPTDAVGVFCAATALLAFVTHLLVEETRWPGAAAWLAIVLLGLGPVGLAFYVWDHGVKRGDEGECGADHGRDLLLVARRPACGSANAMTRQTTKFVLHLAPVSPNLKAHRPKTIPERSARYARPSAHPA